MRSALLLVVRSEVRRSRWGLLGLALLVTIVAGVVMAGATGARRTSSSLDRFVEDAATSDGRVLSFVLGDADAVAAIREAATETEGVRRIVDANVYITDASTTVDVPLLADPEGELFVEVDRLRVLEGRLPDPEVPTEVALSPAAADNLDVGPGDPLPVRFFSPEDCAALAQDEYLGFNSPTIPLEVTGVVRQVEDLQGSVVQSTSAYGTPAFATTYGDEACAAGHGMALQLDDDADVGALQDALTAAVPQAEAIVETADDLLVTIRSAVDVSVTALVAFTLVSALAGAVALGQAVGRQVTAGGATREALEAIGLDRRQRAVVLAAPALVATVVGVAGGAILAVAASPLFPIGVARDAEPDDGVMVDGSALAVTALGLLVLVGVTAWIVARRRSTAGAAVVTGQSNVVAAALRAGAGPSASLGLRLAYDRTPDRTAAPARTAIAGVLVGVAGVVGVLVMVGSLDAVRDAPERWGWTWDAKPDNGGDLAPGLRRGLEAEPGVAAVALLENGSVTFGDTVVKVSALVDRTGHTEFEVLDGRLPAGPTEVGLGRQALEDLDVAVGDAIVAVDPEGVESELTVVGETVVPMIDVTSPGDGAVLTSEAFRALTVEEESGQLVLTYEDGVDVGALEARLHERYALEFPEAYARPQEPGRLINMADTRALILGLGGFFASLAVAGLTHAVVVSARRQRHPFAVLRSIGMRRAQVRRAVVVQAVAIVVAGALVGIPVGVVVGRTAWLASVRDLGMVDDPTTPLRAVGVVAVAAVLLGTVIALVTGWAGARRRPADALRSE